MGEAKRRAHEIEAMKAEDVRWRVSLTDEERAILQLAERLDSRLVRGKEFSEGCYHLAFFMTRYLQLQGIEVIPVIGWINDGQWDGVASHAWIEYQGKKTDASLTYTSEPSSQPTGGLIVLDREIRKGEVSYTYYSNEDSIAQAKLENLRAREDLRRLVQFKDEQHQIMLKIAANNAIDQYLANSPPGGRFADLASLVK